jgi:hypothetical protein
MTGTRMDGMGGKSSLFLLGGYFSPPSSSILFFTFRLEFGYIPLS